jgi:transposase
MEDPVSPHESEISAVPPGILIDFLGLENCVTLRTDKIEHLLLVRATYEQPLDSVHCPSGHANHFREVPESTKILCFWDIPRGKRVVLVQLVVVPIACTECDKFVEMRIPWLDEDRQMSYRLRDYILSRMTTLATLEQIALETGVDEKMVGEVFREAFNEEDAKRSKDLPRVLGIDEVFFHGRSYTILVNGETGKAVDLLKGLRKEEIKPRFEEAGNRGSVEYVLQDFSVSHRSLSKKVAVGRLVDALQDPESSGADEQDYPLFRDLPDPEPIVSEEEEQKAALSARKQLKVLLPNARIVGDHYHFKSKIQDGFDKALKGLLEAELHTYRKTLLRRYKKERPLQTIDWIEHEVGVKIEERKNELNVGSYLLRKAPKNLKKNEWQWIKLILGDHPSLRQAWDAKNNGLNIFSEKPRMEITKKSRAEVLAVRSAMLMNEVEAARRLDDWAASLDPKLREFFRTPLNLIRDWREELIRIGTTIYTNADTESKNHFLRLLAANSRGLEYEMLRARLLWADDHGRSDRWPSCFASVKGRIDPPRLFRLASREIARRGRVV